MPWNSTDAPRHTKEADSPVKRRQWADIANKILKQTGDEGQAIKEANAAVARNKSKK